jgi:1-deoxy-D-xylulose-5-phosphate synthase
MMEKFPERTFDVGIAEQHAVTLAAGMATQGMTVFCNIYSTFLQRAYDQVIHDVALQNLPVIFCIDRAGFVGEDGATHHGLFDIAYLSCIPNIMLLAPINEIELRQLLYTTQLGIKGPIAIRYPRGRGFIQNWQVPFEKLDFIKATPLKTDGKIAILSTGTIGNNVRKAIEKVQKKNSFSHYHFMCIKPLDEFTLEIIGKKYTQIITIEEGTILGGFGSMISHYYSEKNSSIKIKKMGVRDEFIEQGIINELHDLCGLSVEKLVQTFEKF